MAQRRFRFIYGICLDGS